MSLPMNGTWKTVAPMPTARHHIACAAIDKKIYCIGGSTDYSNHAGTVTNVLEIYDTEKNVWSVGSPAPTNIYIAGVAVYNRKIYCVGGANASGYLNKIHIYDVDSSTWSTSSITLSVARYGLKCCVVEDKLFCIGGGTNSLLDIVEIINLTEGTITTGAPLPKAGGSCCATYGNYIYWIGGQNTAPYSVYRYDIIANSWETVSQIPFYHGAFGYAQSGTSVYCVGGSLATTSYAPTDKFLAFNMDNYDITAMPSLPSARRACECAIVEGKLYAIGGFTLTSVLDEVAVYPAESPTPPSDKCCCTKVKIEIETCSCNTDLLTDLNNVLEKDGKKGCGTSGCK